MNFRKRINLSKLFRLNVTSSGISASVGPRGLNIGVGKRGVHLNASIPGTGLYHRQKLFGFRKRGNSLPRLSPEELQKFYESDMDGFTNVANIWYETDREYYNNFVGNYFAGNAATTISIENPEKVLQESKQLKREGKVVSIILLSLVGILVLMAIASIIIFVVKSQG